MFFTVSIWQECFLDMISNYCNSIVNVDSSYYAKVDEKANILLSNSIKQVNETKWVAELLANALV